MRVIVFCLGMLLLLTPLAAQEGLNLPTALYVLANSGVVERYGLGAEGIFPVTTEDEFVLDMAVAPDGNWMAYRTEQGLRLVEVFTGSTLDIEGQTASVPPIRGRGETMAWTHKGDALAYTTLYGARVYFNDGLSQSFTDIHTDQLLNLSWSPDGRYLAAEADSNIWWIFRREDRAMLLTSAIPSSFGTAWINETELVFVPDSGGVLAMDLAAGNVQRTILSANMRYRLPVMQADGTLLVYGRQPGDPAVAEGFGQLYSVNLQSSQQQRMGESAVDLKGLRWGPAGNLLVAIRGGALALVNRTTGEGLTLPISSAVAYTWGPLPPETAPGLRLPVDGYFLAVDGSGLRQVWRLNRDGSAPVPLTAAQADVVDYAVSPNGRSVAYVSADKLWLLALDGTSEAVELADAAGASGLAFSPDNQRVAYVLAEGSPDAGIWLAPVEGGAAEQLLANDETTAYDSPQFAPNINALLVTVRGGEGTRLGVLDLSARELQDIGAYEAGRWARDGRIMAYGSIPSALSETPLLQIILVDLNDLAQPVTVFASPSPLLIEDIVEAQAGRLRALLKGTVPGSSPVEALDLSIGGDPTPVGEAGYMIAPQLTPDGSVAAGYTYPGGALIVAALDGARRVMIEQPGQVAHFKWAG